VSPLKNNEKRIRLSSRIVINRFEGSCGTFGKEKKPIVINDIGLLPPPKKKSFIFIFIFKQWPWGGC
jgi:hypothetical protein